jgi:predicted ribosomally synthesized peptide with nif11-like leader
MSKETLEALLAKLKSDDGLQEKLKAAANLDDAVKLANEGGGLEDSRLDFL